MGQNITEKILARASRNPNLKPGDIAVVAVDTAVLLDTSFMPHCWREVLKVADPDKLVVVFDHKVPPPNRVSAQGHMTGREFVKRFGIKRFHDLGRDVGISHVLVTDRAYALPGTVLVCADSHTCAAGAFNCAGRGVGVPEMVYAITTGKTWFRLGETVRYDLVGALQPGVTTKDVFLNIAGVFGDHTNRNMEFGGPGLADLSLNARRTIATQAAEVGAEFAVFEPDAVLLDYVRAHSEQPFEAQYPDADATYAERHAIDLAAMEPMVALPDAVIKNTVRVSEVAGETVHQAFIGSCANGTLDDFAIAARIVAGRQVAPGVRLIVTPGSQEIYRNALKAGYVATLVEAGALVTNSTCGACAGGHMGVVGPGETCITASTRNFKGRMGDPTSRVFMASTATVAASALTGVITHPGQFIDVALTDAALKDLALT
jgi:3-isopropylmalate/(R)-2-methylmalate dehydratase large subunit